MNFLKPSENICLNTISHPIFKCLPPPKFKQLKKIILNRYNSISKIVKQPIFATLKHKTIGNVLIRSTFQPTNENIIDIYLSCTPNNTTQPQTTTEVLTRPSLPLLTPVKPNKCHHPRCATCQHFNTQNHFSSTTTRKTFRIRHPFTCNSHNIIYLITCNKCKKQYVGSTHNSLKERFNHHRSSILRKEKRYVSVHFNFSDHSLKNLTVQIIDTTSPQKLFKLEKYWMNTLKTKIPNGLNYTYRI